MLKAPKLWIPGPQDCILQHLFEPEAVPEGGIRPLRWYQKLPVTVFYRANMLNKIPKIHIKSFKTVDARASGLHFQHLVEPEAGPEGGIRKDQ